MKSFSAAPGLAPDPCALSSKPGEHARVLDVLYHGGVFPHEVEVESSKDLIPVPRWDPVRWLQICAVPAFFVSHTKSPPDGLHFVALLPVHCMLHSLVKCRRVQRGIQRPWTWHPSPPHRTGRGFALGRLRVGVVGRRGRGAEAVPGPLPGGRKTASYGEDIVPSTAAVEEDEKRSFAASAKYPKST